MSLDLRPICLTAWLLAATLAPAAPPQSGKSAPTAKPASESKIEQLLKTPVTLSYRDAPLSKVIEDLRTAHGLNIVVDALALEENGASLDSAVKLYLEQVSLRSALNLILHQCQLTWVIKDDVLLVTTPEQARGKLRQLTYQVADLIVPVNRSPVVLSLGGDVVKCDRATTKEPATTEKELIQLITSTIAPRQWSEMGGPGTIDYHTLTMSLVVNQTPDIQEQVADLLVALRRLQDVEVSLEIRLLRLPAEFCERAGLELQGDDTKLLKPAEFERLLAAAQKDPRTNVMQAPKLIVFDGQQVTFNFEDAGKGLSLNVLPNASADRRSLKMEMMQSLWNPRSGQGFSKKLEIPDGVTVVSGCWTTPRESTGEPPILSKIPYVSRLFKTAPGQQTDQVLVCVTPRVIVQEEEEPRPTGFLRGLLPAEEAQEATPAEQAQDLVKQYQQACAEGDLKKAKKLARKALNLDPTCFDKQP
jgi:type II secretory pathway component GspD/PulD (secretin)